MSIENLKKMKNEKGFTIVELLIVIVVIGILAAIVIVAYNGVTQRANTTKAKTNASSVQKRAESFNADDSAGAGNGAYPATASAWTTYTSSNTTAAGAIPAGISVVAEAAGALTNSNGGTTVTYKTCTTGYRVGYYDYTNTASPAYIYGAGATSAAC